MNNPKHRNRLVNSSSPYLLQHAHNPVDWYEWGPEALERAKSENKPIIVSIGYSACHWCHVMERESFENEAVADVMNAHFVCIKVDREERPDVDSVYMDAVHAMGQQGGWPLNVFLLPDQRPFYGGTYFPAEGWSRLCLQIAKVFKEQQAELEKSAADFMKNIGRSEVEKYGLVDQDSSFTKEALHEMFKKFEENFDYNKGGNNRAPKFPMPVTYQFLLREGVINKNESALDHVKRTLDNMAWGGLYDQVGGGFTRYSTDMDWFVPHFEKMLYDNGQLLSLYAEAYQHFKDSYYAEVISQTFDWLEREILSPEGGLYSALDADSEGEEGKFYLWTTEEIEEALGPDAQTLIEYYNITSGNWEPNKNIPFKSEGDVTFAKSHGLELEELKDLVKAANLKLLNERAKRVRPGLDDKILTAWNALTIIGLCDAYAALGNDKYLSLAITNSEFVWGNLWNGQTLFRNYKDGKASINAYLEDYATLINAFLKLYEVTFSEEWISKATLLIDLVIDQFYDHEEELFFFTPVNGEKLIARKKEIFDNVIPSSNALMADALHKMSMLLDHSDYGLIADKMLKRIDRIVTLAPQDLAYWSRLYGERIYPTAEIVSVTENIKETVAEIGQYFNPNRIIAGKKADTTSKLPLLEGRELLNKQSTFYLCYNKACQLPVNSVEELVDQITTD